MLNIFRRRKKEDREYYRMLKDIFGLKPNNVELYKLALIHRSASRFLRQGVPINNERLEFLGDAVIESVVSDYLFGAFPYENEGFLTQMRSRMVNRATLNELCKDIGLAKYIRNNANGGGVQRNMNGDAFEAIIGAMYLDKGYEITNKVLIKVLSSNITLDEVRTTETDFKSRLIEWCQKGRHHLRFSTSFGPGGSQNAPQFKSVAIIDGYEVAYGLGSSKKEAEQRAAYTVSQALSDDMGEKILEMMDKSLGDKPETKPRRRRKRGGVKHRKVASSTTVGSEQMEEKQPQEEIKKEDQVVETTVAEGVVSVSVEETPKPVKTKPDEGARSETGAPAKRRGRPRKVVAKGEATETKPKAQAKSKADAPAKADASVTKKPKAPAKTEQAKDVKPETSTPAKRRGRPRKMVAEGERAEAKPEAQTKSKNAPPTAKTPAATKPKAAAKSKTDTSPRVGASAKADVKKAGPSATAEE